MHVNIVPTMAEFENLGSGYYKVIHTQAEKDKNRTPLTEEQIDDLLSPIRIGVVVNTIKDIYLHAVQMNDS